jgi:hypothetical protein
MKDFLDQELAVGDSIVVAVNHGRNAGASLNKGTIKRFTPKRVEYEVDPLPRWGDGLRQTCPSKVVKVLT